MVLHPHRPQHIPIATSPYNEVVPLLVTMTGHYAKYSIHLTSGRTSVEKRNNTMAARVLACSRTVILPDQKAFKSLRM